MRGAGVVTFSDAKNLVVSANTLQHKKSSKKNINPQPTEMQHALASTKQDPFCKANHSLFIKYVMDQVFLCR